MNSSDTYGWSTSQECELYRLLGGKPDQTTTEDYVVFVIVMNIITCPITTFLNAFVIISVKIKRRLRTKSSVALGCLAVTDFLMGLIGQPLFIADTVVTLQVEDSSENCTLKQSSSMFARLLGKASLYHMILINLERYIAIKHPFAHETMVTEARILGISAVTWILVLFQIPLMVASNDVYLPVSNTLVIVSLVIIIFCQVVVYYEAHRQKTLIAAQQVSVEARRKFLKENKALKLMSTILFILILNYLPLIVVRILLITSVFKTINARFFALFTSGFVLILNSLINPVIYCLRIRQFRVAFIEILFCKSNSQAENIDMRLCGSRNAVLPALGEAEARLEGRNNDDKNSNHGSNNNHSGSNSINNNKGDNDVNYKSNYSDEPTTIASATT